MARSKPVYYKNKKYENMHVLAESINVSAHTLFCCISHNNYKGERLSYNPPEAHSVPKEQPVHVPGTPLLRNPCTCLISSNWKG